MDWVWKSILIVLLAPLVIGLVTQVLVAALATVLPLLVALAVLVGITAGATAGLILLPRLPKPSRHDSHDGEFPIPPPEPVRRPRGTRRPGD